MCTAADAICCEHYSDYRARILSQTVAVVNSIFVVPLFFAAVSLLVHLLFVYVPARFCKQDKHADGGVQYQQESQLLFNHITDSIARNSITTTTAKAFYYGHRSPYEITGGSSLEASSRSRVQSEFQYHHQVFSTVDIH